MPDLILRISKDSIGVVIDKKDTSRKQLFNFIRKDHFLIISNIEKENILININKGDTIINYKKDILIYNKTHKLMFTRK